MQLLTVCKCDFRNFNNQIVADVAVIEQKSDS